MTCPGPECPLVREIAILRGMTVAEARTVYLPPTPGPAPADTPMEADS